MVKDVMGNFQLRRQQDAAEIKETSCGIEGYDAAGEL